ncbi:MAG TPA: hypothetical protein VF062_16875 [Candidatus Limnocylindrales bacterium]
MHRLVVEVDGRSIGFTWMWVLRAESTLAAAVVSAVRDVEGHGYKVVGVRTGRTEMGEAAGHVLGLRALAGRLSEEEMAMLLDLLPL